MKTKQASTDTPETYYEYTNIPLDNIQYTYIQRTTCQALARPALFCRLADWNLCRNIHKPDASQQINWTGYSSLAGGETRPICPSFHVLQTIKYHIRPNYYIYQDISPFGLQTITCQALALQQTAVSWLNSAGAPKHRFLCFLTPPTHSPAHTLKYYHLGISVFRKTFFSFCWKIDLGN